MFTDTLTWINSDGKHMRLWITEETEVGNPQKYMNQLVYQIDNIINDEPIDIYINATYLPLN